MKKIVALILVLAMGLTLCACGGVDERYTALIECLDNHDYEGAYSEVMGLRQQAIDNGDIVIVEPQEEDYELVNQYRNIVRFLQDYSPSNYSSIWNRETDEYYSGNEGLAYAYSELSAMADVDQWLDSEYFDFEEGFPTDRAALLARFSMLADKQLSATRSTVDNMGNENSDTYTTWYYDAEGTLTSANYEWSAAQQNWEGLYTQSGTYNYTYNDAGVVTETRITNYDGSDVYAIVTPSFDDKGNMISETIVDNNGERVFHYSYDSNGNLTKTEYKGDWESYGIIYNYDDAGKLISKERHTYGTANDEQYSRNIKTTAYTYDASGNLASATVTYTSIGYRWDSQGITFYTSSEKIDNVTYTTDAQGRVIQEDWQYGETTYKEGNPDKPDNTSATIEYSYGDYYIFN